MAKDPAILFYTSDFLTGTFTMTNEQVGKYIKLLCLQHQKGKLTTQDMEFVCGGSDPQVFAKFQLDERGFYFNATLQEHADKRKAYSESRKKNRKKPTEEKDMNNICETYDKHMENENEIINTNNKSAPINPSLMEIYFKDLENSSVVETIAMNTKTTMDQVKAKIPLFKSKARLVYPNYNEFADHFKNWYNIQLKSQPGTLKAKEL